MGFNTSGYILKCARSAPSNARTTAGANSGVLREHSDLPGSYDLPGDFIEVAADQYRTAVLDAPDVTTQEYLFWAANSSNLAILEDPSWEISQGSGRIPIGTMSFVVGPITYVDGTDRVVVSDNGGRSIAGITSVTLVRGDDPLNPIVATTFASQDADAGLVTLDASTLAALGGGLSITRGDVVTSTTYYLAAQKFWWTRNDADLQRFGWDGATQRWSPFKGAPPQALGEVSGDGTYVLLPRLTRFAIGDMLPGDPLQPDAIAMVRVGARPDATSTPARVLVASDEDAATTYSFPLGIDAIVGVTSGVLQWNPLFVAIVAGRQAWYIYETFPEASEGVLGDISDVLFLCPIPGPTDYPFVRIGSRRHLRAIAADTDVALAALVVAEGEVGWSLTTGKLKLSTIDVAKADPNDAGFDLLYLGAQVVYDGVSLTRIAVSTRAPCQVVDASGTPTTVSATGEIFVPSSMPLASPGRSGVMLVPDGTGVVPNTSAVPGTRPNGSGLIREVTTAGDLVLFGRRGCIETLDVVEFDSELPAFSFRLARGRAVVARELHSSGAGSRLALGLRDRQTLAGEPLYFLQAIVQPAVYATEARVVSRQREPFVLDGNEVLSFAVDGVAYLWSASSLGAGSYSAAEIAASINGVIVGTGSGTALGGRILLSAGNLSTGSVEIGFGTTGAFVDRDFSGCAILGFLPGWRVSNPSGSDNWLPDAGLALGVSRSPQNRSGGRDISDFMARGRFSDVILSRNVIASPVFFLNNPPLLDVAGYDVGVFLQTIDGPFRRPLRPLEDVLYQASGFSWLEVGTLTAGVVAPAESLPLGHTSIVGLTMHPAVGDGYGLYIDADGSGTFVSQVLGSDYLLDANGATGNATLIEEVGARVSAGALGVFVAASTTFEDPDATFLSDGVAPGYRLKITGGSENARGSYVVASVTSETELEIEAEVPFPLSGTTVAWEMYEGYTPDVYDPGLLADVLYESFNHLPDEPFQIRVLSPLGETPADVSAQSLARLRAVVVAAIERGRPMAVRFGLASDSEATISPIERSQLGVMANGVLSVPDLSDPHFIDGAFSIRVGDVAYTIGTNLTGVMAFTDPLVGDQVEYGLPASGITGQLKFGTTTLVEMAESLVAYAQEFSAPADLSVGQAEVDPRTGDLNLSAADMAAHAGADAYFVEQMITEGRLDVAVGPMQGAITFSNSLRAFQVVEVRYLQADSSGNPMSNDLVVEFLPLFVRLEVATVTSTTTCTFNPTGRTIRSDVGVQVWVDGRLQNYGNAVDCAVDGVNRTITFVSPISPTSVVQINYAVIETFGGEQGFTVSSPPVYRPPFFLLAGEDSFVLATDRTIDVVPGKLLRVGATPFYVKDVVYDAGVDETTVTIFPTPGREAGSRSPGNDVLTLLSSVPVATSVDGTPTGGAAGFLMTLVVPYEPAATGTSTLLFLGDITAFAVAGHLLEIGGHPFVIAGSEMSVDGLATRVDLTSPFSRDFDFATDEVKVSVRPVYPPDTRNILGPGSLVDVESTEIVLFGEVSLTGIPLPGRTLVQGRDYAIDLKSGNVTLLSPAQQALRPGERLNATFTRKRVLAPFVKDGTVILPRYRAGYAYITIPTEENGFLGAYLTSTYSFESPDSFYVRVVPMIDYLGEVAQVAVDRVAARTPHGGPVVVSGPPQTNWSFGTLPIRAQERELQDQDRAARVFLSLYDDFTQALEQVKEAMSGDVVGDRDGKFRFFVGRGRVYGGPGYEDLITGLLQSRFVWSQVFDAASGSFGVTEADPIVDPETATQDPTTLVVSGSPMNPWLLDFYIRQQRKYVLNDMDDTVLVRKRTQLRFPFDFRQMGVFAQTWEPSLLSRLYPEATLAFTTTYPGLLSGTLPDDPGVYAFLKLVARPGLLRGSGPVFGSTFGMDIGVIANPALGLIENITGQVRPRARLARARVWAYSATGFPMIDPATTGKPSIIATPLPLREFPIDQTTGFPDVTQLAANGGDLPDLSTGDIELSTPAWVAYSEDANERPQVAMGRPSGETYSIGYAGETLTSALSGAFTFDPTYKGIFVGGIYAGCVLTFTSGDGSEIISASDIVVIGEDGISISTFAPTLGDTIYVIPPGSEDASGYSDPPTAEELEKLARQQPMLDVGVRERGSTFVDRSLPSKNDPSPFPLKEVLNQRTASPLQPIEAEVEFVNAMRDPLEFPALRGLGTNDSGDHTLPYLMATSTELERLAAVQGVFSAIVETDSPAPAAVYPDEIVGDDGIILAVSSGGSPPATLLSARDLTPVTTAGVYTPHTGIADTRRYDILLVERGQANVVDGAEGILSVGAVSTNQVEVPRFVTQTLTGTRIRYVFDNVMVHLSTTGTTGVVVEENGGTTTLDISTMSGLVLNDGSGLITGGLNNIVGNSIFAYPNNNLITIDIIDQGTGLILETVTLQASSATGGLGTVVMGGAPIATDKVLTLAAIGFVDFAALGGVAPGPVGPFDFRVSIDTFVAPATLLTGSDVAYVDNDRLTFVEALDLRSVRPRGTLTSGGVSVQGELSVYVVTASGSTSCVANHPTIINGGDPFTFLARDSLAPDDIGSFDPFPGTRIGRVKVMSLEGANNTPIPSLGSFVFSTVPSSDQDENGDILSGIGSVYDTGVVSVNPNSIVGVTPATGALSNVVAGDIVVIATSSVGDATTKAGTHLVRHAIEDLPSSSGYHEVFPIAVGGVGAGWLRSPFPTVVSSTAGSITVSGIQTVALSPSGFDWEATGRLYLFVSPADLTSTLSRTYTAFVVNGDNTVTFTLGVGTAQDATGGAVTDAAFDAAAAIATGRPVSGMVFLPIGQFPNPLPSNNVVGHDHGITTVGGFSYVTLVGVGGSYIFAFGLDLVDATPVWVPVVDQFGVAVSDATTTGDGTAFAVDPASPVYLDVPLYADLRGLADGTSTVYATIHGVGASAVRCVAPGDRLRADDGLATPGTGFHAVAGLFLEPSWSRSTLDLGDGVPKVVDATTSAPSVDYVGMRAASSLFVAAPEAIAFSVRRIRRFHTILDGVGLNLAPLRFAYETRRGVVASYTAATRILVASPDPESGGGTQLGGFDDQDVNVNPGDLVHILDASGNVVDAAEIASITDSVTLRLRSPGLVENPPLGGEAFRVYLRQAPVPHTQSNEQLLALVTDSVLHESVANPVTGDGGRVTTVGFLEDPSVPDFTTLGIRPGDIVLVDPAGELAGATGVAVPPEFGARPLGDQSVSSRLDGSYVAGGPSDLDDNRGWYRVVAVTSSAVEVSGETDFTGVDGSPVIFGATTPTNQQFVVYPDIHASGLTSTTEGQMDLRPTKPALPSNSYQDGSFRSIEPFSYRIFRPTSLVESATVDLILMLRERMLSFLEEMEPALRAEKQGSYYVFQRDEHDLDLGSPTETDEGLGIPSNGFISSIAGLTQYAPFANVSDCLSILDRRYWVLDARLDHEFPPYSIAGDPYASFEVDISSSGYTVGSGRPVAPDLVDEVLDRSDRLRSLRYSWIKFRSNKTDGTLPAIDRFLADLPRLLQEEADFLRMQQSIDDAE